MLAVLSPAKKLDMTPLEGVHKNSEATAPELWSESTELLKTVRHLSRAKLKALMTLSDDLANLNYQRFQDFEDTDQPLNGKQALFAFAGDTFVGLDAGSLSAQDMSWAQGHLRILSGFYGLLRPLDIIQPYRLEMGTRLKTKRGETLYKFWGSTISEALPNKSSQDILVNLASKEYSRALEFKKQNLRIITPVFKKNIGGEFRTLGFVGKRMRGAMARFMIQGRLTDPKDLLEFNADGLRYMPELSTPDAPVFVK